MQVMKDPPCLCNPARTIPKTNYLVLKQFYFIFRELCKYDMSPSVGEVLFQVVQILCKAQSDRALPDLMDLPDLPSPTVIHELANKALVICSPGNYAHTLLYCIFVNKFDYFCLG